MGCSGGNKEEVAYCPVTTCALWEFRFGRPMKETDPQKKDVKPKRKKK